MSAPWAPMAAPPLPVRNDAEYDTCPHGYPAEECFGGWDKHWRELTESQWAEHLASGMFADV